MTRKTLFAIFFVVLFCLRPLALVGSEPVNPEVKRPSMMLHASGSHSAGRRSERLFQTVDPLEVEVVRFTRFDPLSADIPTCKDCAAITVVFCITCMDPDSCEGLSVMNSYVTYESDTPTLFYGDELPNPFLQGDEYGGFLYGAQKEFAHTSLSLGETAIGQVSFTVNFRAHHLVFHYVWGGINGIDISTELAGELK